MCKAVGSVWKSNNISAALTSLIWDLSWRCWRLERKVCIWWNSWASDLSVPCSPLSVPLCNPGTFWWASRLRQRSFSSLDSAWPRTILRLRWPACGNCLSEPQLFHWLQSLTGHRRSWLNPEHEHPLQPTHQNCNANSWKAKLSEATASKGQKMKRNKEISETQTKS